MFIRSFAADELTEAFHADASSFSKHNFVLRYTTLSDPATIAHLQSCKDPQDLYTIIWSNVATVVKAYVSRAQQRQTNRIDRAASRFIAKDLRNDARPPQDRRHV